MNQHLTIEKISEQSQDAMLRFLKRHENYSLFLLGNFQANGGSLGHSPYSGNYKLIKRGETLVGVFCLFKSGSLIVQSEEKAFDQILQACQEEPIVLRALLGEWEYCSALWKHLQERNWIQKITFQSKEVLQHVDLKDAQIASSSDCRLLTSADYSLWKPLRKEYIQELRYPIPLTEEQMQDLYNSKVAQQIIWGAFSDGQLVATADLNAQAFDLGQVGGVFTAPSHRKQGFATALLRKLMQDAKEIHKIRKLMIFTSEKNEEARKLYSSLGASPVGSFAIFFGEKSP